MSYTDEGYYDPEDYEGGTKKKQPQPQSPPPKDDSTSITGIVQTVICQRDDWFLAKLRGGQKITGLAGEGELKQGHEYRFFGSWVEHPQYGKQFQFEFAEEQLPDTSRGRIEYLQRHCPGIGDKIAARLVEQYGDQAIETLRENPDQVASEIQGLRCEIAKQAAAILNGKKASERTVVELMTLFHGRGFPKSLIPKIVRKYGDEAAVAVRRNPYLLLRYPGVGFLRADLLALDLGYRPDKLRRQLLAICHAIDTNGNGHTWFELDWVREQLGKLVSGQLRLTKAIQLGLRAGYLATDHGSRIALAESAAAERIIADKISQLLRGETHWPSIRPAGEGVTIDDDGLSDGLSDHQVEQITEATSLPVGLFTGGPGTGKTYTLCRLIAAIRRESIVPIFVVAPTGKAAVRITEQMGAAGLGIQGQTIHRLLMWVGDGFGINAANPLPPCYLIVDESSMVDSRLLAALLSAVQVGSHVLFVGDPGQLLPVGEGAPFRDLIESQLIPRGHLTEVRRNAGKIVEICDEIGKGKYWPGQAEPESNFAHWTATTPDSAKQTILELIASAKAAGWDPVKSVQVLCITNKKSDLGKDQLNDWLQQLLNPGPNIGKSRFRLGDKVMCQKNTRMVCLESEEDHQTWGRDLDDVEVSTKDRRSRVTFVSNGDIGYITRADRSVVEVEWQSPRRLCRCSVSGPNSVLSLAYAITVHKSQGSESPYVIYVADTSPAANWLATRELHYTAISRAKQYCAVVGVAHRIEQQCKKTAIGERVTGLREVIERSVEQSMMLAMAEGF